MKREDQAGIWRQLGLEPSTPRLSRLIVKSSPVLAPQTISLGRFTVLTGTHGVGKSYLLRVLGRATRSSGGVVPQGPPYLGDYDRTYVTEPLQGVFEAEYVDGSRTCCWSIDLAVRESERYSLFPDFEPDAEPWTSYVDATAALTDIAYLHGESYFRQRLSVPVDVPKDEPARLRKILGRSYDRVSWQECTDQGAVLPFFSARSNGRDYTSDTMSMGELWVLYVLWILRTASPSNIVLIDEPEAFLSPSGHAAFLHEIARKALASKVQVVIATHSTAMISAAPIESLRVLTGGATGAAVSEPSTTTAVLRVLGQEPGVRAVVVVEDEFAAMVIRRTLAVLAPDISGSIDVVKAGGADSAINAGRALSTASRLATCVVLDGDQRDRVVPNPPPLAYLPGHVPEVGVSAPSRTNPDVLAGFLGRTVDAVTYALDGNRFDDHHDWFSSAAISLDVSREKLIDNVVLDWLADESTSLEARRLVEDVRAALRL